MTSDHVGIGIVGSGFIAGAHAEAFARLPRANRRGSVTMQAGSAAMSAAVSGANDRVSTSSAGRTPRPGEHRYMLGDPFVADPDYG